MDCKRPGWERPRLTLSIPVRPPILPYRGIPNEPAIDRFGSMISLVGDEETSVDLGGEESTPLAYSEVVEEPVQGSWWSASSHAVMVLAGCLMTAAVVLVGWRAQAVQYRSVPTPAPRGAASSAPPAVSAPTVLPPSDNAAQKITPPPAPDPDTEFLAAMDRAQVHMASEAAAIEQGHRVCRSLDSGASVQGVTAKILSISPGLSEPQVRTVVWAAVDAYCPQFDNRGER